MSLRNLLGIYVDVVDSYLVGSSSDSPFHHHAARKLPPFIRGDVDVIAPSGVSDGGKYTFTLPRTADLCGRIVFCADVAALVNGSAGAGYPRPVDAFPYRKISKVVVSHEVNTLQELDAEAIYYVHNQMRSSDDSFAALSYSGMQADTSGRAALGASGFEMYLELPLMWTLTMDSFLPIHQDFVRGNITIEVSTRTVAETTETDAGTTTGGALSNVRLRCEYIWLAPSDHDAIIAEQASVNELTGTPGWARMVTAFDVQSLKGQVASGTNEQSFTLTSRAPVACMDCCVIADSNRPSAGGVANPFGFVLPASWSMSGVSTKIVQSRTGKYSSEYDAVVTHAGASNNLYFGRSWALNPALFSANTGYLNMNPIPDSTLAVIMKSSWSSTGTLHVILAKKMILVLEPSGDYHLLYNI